MLILGVFSSSENFYGLSLMYYVNISINNTEYLKRISFGVWLTFHNDDRLMKEVNLFLCVVQKCCFVDLGQENLKNQDNRQGANDHSTPENY